LIGFSHILRLKERNAKKKTGQIFSFL